MSKLKLATPFYQLTSKIGDFIVEYLRVFVAICKKALTRESGARGGLFDEKYQRSKISL
jgi:hypothetical protein